MTEDVDRLLGWFERGSLLRPDAEKSNTVDLTRALAHLCDAPGFATPGALRVAETIGESDHLVFVLVDGLGMNLIETMPEDAFLRSHVCLELRSVFPSATASAITTLATGHWPSTHGVTGWWTYLAEHGLSMTSLPFIERYSKDELGKRGITTADVFPLATILPQFQRKVCTFQPQHIIDSAYSRYLRGDTATTGYEGVEVGVDAVLEFLKEQESPTYSYYYISTLDHISHEHGPDSEQASAHLREIDAALTRLAEGLAGKARLAISADHGQITVPDSEKQVLKPDDPLLALLEVAPTGEPRSPYFHVKPGEEERFRALFIERFGEGYALLTAAETEELELLGPGPMAPESRARIGTFQAIAGGKQVLLSRKDDQPTGTELIHGYHGGLLRDEVRIPLICA